MVKRKKTISSKKIPLGAQLIAIWVYIVAFFTFLVGLLMVLIKGFALTILEQIKVLPNSLAPIISIVLLILGIFLIILGIFYYFLARGLWKGKNWARITQLVFSVLAALSGLASLPTGLVGLAINVAIIWYIGFNDEGKKYYSS
jgi:hypothetical protein